MIIGHFFRYDRENMEETARAVIKHNRSLAGSRVDDVVMHMIALAEDNLAGGRGGYAGTYGYILSVYLYPGTDEPAIHASVAAHLVA